MGCCFSKELSSDSDTETTGLLQKSVEQKEPENKISKTLSLLFDPLEGEKLHNVGNGASRAAADINTWTRIFVRPGRKEGPRPKQSLNAISSSMCNFLTTCENLDEINKNSDIVVTEQNPKSVCDAPCVGHGSRQGCSEDDGLLPHVPVRSEQGLQEEAFVHNHPCYYLDTCKNSLIEKEIMVNVQISSFSNPLDVSNRKINNENPIVVSHKQCQNSRESEFYSICVVDPDCLNIEEELCTAMCGAAVEECHSAVTSEGMHKVEWPLDNKKECSVSPAMQGTRDLKPQQKEQSSQGMLDPNERKEVFSEKTKPWAEILTDCNSTCKADTDHLQTESSHIEAYTKFLKDNTESSASHDIGLLPGLNINIDADSPLGMCTIPEKRKSHSSGIGIQMDHSPINLRNDILFMEGNNEPKNVTVSVGQSLDSKKVEENNSVKPLKDSDFFQFVVSRPDSILPVGVDGINLSPKRFITSVSFESECLPVHSRLQEVTSNRLDNGPRPEHLLGPTLAEEQQVGDNCLEARTLPLVSKVESSLQSDNSISHQDEDRCQADLHVASRAQAYDLTLMESEIDLEGVGQRIDHLRLRFSKAVFPNDEFHGHSRSCQSNLISSTYIFTSNDEAERVIGLNGKTEGEIHMKTSFSGLHNQLSDPNKLEDTEKELLKANCRDSSEDDIENVKSESKTTCDWQTGTLEHKALPGQDVLICVSSVITENPDLESNQIGKKDEIGKVSNYKDLNAGPLLSQSLSSVVQKSELAECSSSKDHEDSLELEYISSESTKESSGAFGNSMSGMDKTKLTHKEEEERLYLEKDSINPNIINCLSPCKTNGHAYHHTERSATATVKESTLNGDTDFVGNSEVIFEKVGLCDTSDAYSCLVGVGPTQVDRYMAVPYDAPLNRAISIDSKEIVVPSCDHVLTLTEDTLNMSENPSRMDWQSFPEEFSHFLNEFSCYRMGGFTSQIFSEKLANSCIGCQVGCLWTDTIIKDAIEDEQIFSEDLLSKPHDLEIASLPLERNHYQLPVSEDGIIWRWQSRGGQLVSTLFKCLSFCCDVLVFTL